MFFPVAWEHNIFDGKVKGVPAPLDDNNPEVFKGW